MRAARVKPRQKAGGGEGARAELLRGQLRALGESAGFSVQESYRLPMAKGADWTRSEIDMVWTLPMPVGLGSLVDAIGVRNPVLIANGAIVRQRFEEVVVVAFELENDSKKHAHGGLLNLASHGMSGVFAAGNEEAYAAAEAAYETYKQIYPLSRVSVWRGFK